MKKLIIASILFLNICNAVTQTGTCSATSTASVTLVSHTGPSNLALGFKKATCSGTANGEISCTVTGGTPTYQYRWSNSNAASAPNQTSPILSNLPVATYTVTVTDVNGCTKTNTLTMQQCALLTTTSGIVSTPKRWDVDNITVMASSTLTLNNLDLYFLNPTSNITVPPLCTLLLNNCTLHGCEEMYQGIINTGGMVTIIDCAIEGATAAISVTNNGKFTITGTIFNNNALSLSASNTDLSTCTLSNCTFDYDNAPSFSEQLPFYHIYLDNVTNANIGSWVPNKKNIYKHAWMGIYSKNSDLTVFNSEFRDIGYYNFEQPNLIIKYGDGIYAYNTSAAQKSITVDQNGTPDACSFINITNGVTVKGFHETTIENNHFDLCKSGVFMYNHQIANVNINANRFDNCYDGIFISRINDAIYQINDNLFNMTNTTTPKAYNAINFGNRAISLLQVKGNAKATIRGNKMNNTREGIYCINIKGATLGEVNIGELNADPNIFSNEYYNSIPQADLHTIGVCYGYNFLNCDNVNLFGNRAIWMDNKPTVAEQDLLRGISLMDSKQMILIQNKTEKLGTGIRYWGDCTMGQLKCNTMTSCYQSVYLDPVGGNTKISDQGDLTGTIKSWGNKWVNVQHTSGFRVDGDKAPFTPIVWTYNTNDPPEQWLLSSQVKPFLISTQSCTATITDCVPPNIAPDDDALRAQLYGAAVGDSSIYNNIDAEFLYQDKTAYFVSALNDSGILYQGNNNDAMFIAEFDSLKNENIGKVQIAKKALANNDYTLMQTKLAALVNPNAIDFNLKSTINYYANYVAKDSIADSTTIENNRSIAYLHPFLGGEGVYYSRAIFDIEHEDQMPQLRKWKPNNNTAIVKHNIEIYPNPSDGNFTIVLKGYNNPQINIFDCYGKLTIKQTLKENESMVELNDYSSGLYYVQVMENGVQVYSSKLIITKK
ncbi:MAG: T9SS type A sorting domain-containing protein [Bacteroidetes bacterium]|nr:T9SS type A sorting domain-containing protein [Bacteroidota bacterium]